MRIDFFEEYPDEKNLSLIARTGFDSTVYLAAHTLEEFGKAAKILEKYKDRAKAAWWPLLEKSYWISPFSYPEELKTLAALLEEKKTPEVLLDQELPIIRKNLFIKNLYLFYYNKFLISSLYCRTRAAGVEISTAEYPAPGPLTQRILYALGISRDPVRTKHNRIVMFYTSMIQSENLKNGMRRMILKNAALYGNAFRVGLGTIAPGVFGNEPVLSPENLNKDLAFLREAGVQTAVIFRLGGLTEEYIHVLRKFSG